jgi:hypothetical protein
MCVSFSVTKLVKLIHSLRIGALYTITTILYKEKSTKIADLQLFKGKKSKFVKYARVTNDYFLMSTHAIGFRLVTIDRIKFNENCNVYKS